MNTVRRMTRTAILLLACALTGAFLSCSDDFYLLVRNMTPSGSQSDPLYVIYDANGATGGTVPDDPAIYHIGFIVTTKGNTGTLTRGGFTFAGWNTQADGNGTSYSQGQTFIINSNVILYARWTSNPTYLLSYNGNGSTGGTVPAGTAFYEQGQLVTVLGNTGSLVRTGFAFNGWNTASNGTGTPYTQGNTFAMPASNVTLYAQWTADPTYTVNYDGNGNNGGNPPTDSTNYIQGNTVTVLDNTGNLTRTNFTFVRWNTAADGSGTNRNPGATFSMGTANVILYAQWAPTYAVTCYGNGNTGGIPPVDSNRYATGQNWTVPGQGTLVRTGHTFAGWNSDAGGGGTVYTVGQIVPMGSANVSLYAQWTADPTYQVSYDGNGAIGGTYPAAPAGYASGQTVNVLGNTGNYTRAGYTFVRWNTVAGGTGIPYNPGDSFVMPSAAVTLYAQWQEPGALDLTFDSTFGVDDIVYSIAVQSDGKILIGGDFTSYDGTGRNRIARLNADGSLDTTFNPGTGANSSIRSIALQSDGKILIGGDFTSYNGTGRNRIARLITNGILDPSFNPGTGATSAVRSIALQSDGKIMIGGEFTFYNGTGRDYIARLNANGSLDATFTPGTAANSKVWSVTVQSDGRILIGGEFTGTGRNRIARLNANGSLDTTFTPGTAANAWVSSIDVQSDGKILIGGDFTEYDGTLRNHVARLNANGTLDALFAPVSGASDYLYSIALQSNGRILIGGHFTDYDGEPRNRIARLNANGTLDTSFDPDPGANDWVSSIAVLSDGRILIGGKFTSYNGTGRSYIAAIIQ